LIHSVTPAQAGAQRGKRPNHPIEIPAFAGMTN
jgi:hypothetical protein